jgi:hypothetical protein
MADRPNIVYFHVDNLGFGELGCYGGGLLRGAETRRIDQFARESFQLLNFAPEAQCTPSRCGSAHRPLRDPQRHPHSRPRRLRLRYRRLEAHAGRHLLPGRLRHDVHGEVAHRRP